MNVDWKSITDEQCIEVLDEAGQPPDDLAASCPTCGAGQGWHCQYGRLGVVNTTTHVKRKEAVNRLAKAWRARCAELWNVRQAVQS